MTDTIRDLPDAELHLLDAGHFALEECGEEIASAIRRFFAPSPASQGDDGGRDGTLRVPGGVGASKARRSGRRHSTNPS